MDGFYIAIQIAILADIMLNCLAFAGGCLMGWISAELVLEHTIGFNETGEVA